MGTSLASLGLISSVAAVLWNFHVGKPQLYAYVCVAADILFLVWWIFYIKASWVRVPAFAYAERLLESRKTLCVQSPKRQFHVWITRTKSSAKVRMAARSRQYPET